MIPYEHVPSVTEIVPMTLMRITLTKSLVQPDTGFNMILNSEEVVVVPSL